MSDRHVINAQVALAARSGGDARWDLLVLLLMQRTGLGQAKVISNIEAMARGETPA